MLCLCLLEPGHLPLAANRFAPVSWWSQHWDSSFRGKSLADIQKRGCFLTLSVPSGVCLTLSFLLAFRKAFTGTQCLWALSYNKNVY